LEHIDPATILVRAADVRVFEGSLARLRVLASSSDRKRSPLYPPHQILIVDGSLDTDAHTALALPSGWNL
jgi:redox-sensitive bicupin YhaK (pirin superfamily)